MPRVISVKEVYVFVLSRVSVSSAEAVLMLNAGGCKGTADLCSDIGISSLVRTAADGFAMCADRLDQANFEVPVQLNVIAEIAARYAKGSYPDGPMHTHRDGRFHS